MSFCFLFIIYIMFLLLFLYIIYLFIPDEGTGCGKMLTDIQVLGFSLWSGPDVSLSHHLEDDSVLLPLTGPEHHSIIWSHKIHRLQHIWQEEINKKTMMSRRVESVWIIVVLWRRFSPFTTRWHCAILMSISSWNRRHSNDLTDTTDREHTCTLIY